MARFKVKSLDVAKRWSRPGRTAMARIGVDLAIKVENRTERGLDEQNRSFAPYRPSTIREKGSSRVNLRGAHGGSHLLDDLGPTRVTETSVRVGFSSPRNEEIAGYLTGGTSRMAARPFLDVPRQWIRDALRKFYRPWR